MAADMLPTVQTRISSMRKCILALAMLLFAACCTAWGQCMPLRPLDRGDLAFKAGENLSYKIHFKWGAISSDVASATLSLEQTTLNGKSVYASRLFGQTSRFYDNFFKLREDFRSWYLTEGLVPQKFYRDTREGRYRCTNDYRFVWDAADPHIVADIETSRAPRFTTEIPLNDCTYDVMTLFYTARNMDMSRVVAGKQYPMTFAIADEVYTIFFVFLGRETRDVKGLGQVRTLKFSVEVVEGDVFTGGSDMILWFSDDENRIPVCFEAPLKIGLVSGRLSEAEGLAHPFSSLVR